MQDLSTNMAMRASHVVPPRVRQAPQQRSHRQVVPAGVHPLCAVLDANLGRLTFKQTNTNGGRVGGWASGRVDGWAAGRLGGWAGGRLGE